MTYVNDATAFNKQSVVLSGTNRPDIHLLVDRGTSRSQHGWRTGPSRDRPPLPVESSGPQPIKAKRPSLTQIDELGSYFHSDWGDLRAEHYRSYHETFLSGFATGTYSYRNNPRPPASPSYYSSDAGVGITGLKSPLPSISENEVRRIAESLRRDTVPAAPGMDLVRTLGELRDVKSLATALPALVSRKTPAGMAGNAYIAYLFGYQPTASDIAYLADAALKLADTATGYVQEQSQRIKARKTRTVSSSFDTAEGNSFITSSPSRFSSLGCSYTVAFNGPQSRFRRHLTVTSKRKVTAYSSFERVIVRNAATDGLSQTKEKLRQLLGHGLTPGTLYDLTPYSWLFDWFYDIGGILRYQENLVGANVVDMGGGYVLRDETAATVNLSGSSEISGYVPTGFLSATSHSRARAYKRRPGLSPYSLTLGWDDLSSSQLAILAALGLSKLA